MKMLSVTFAICFIALGVWASTLEPASAANDSSVELNMIKAEADNGDADAQLLYGLAFLEGRDGLSPDAHRAVIWLRRSAQGGNPYAMLTLGTLYAEGRGVRKDRDQALEWWLKAARKDNPQAQYLTGKALLETSDTGETPTPALEWLDKSAKQGNRDAQFLLGKLFHEGEYVQADQKMARSWLERAAQQAHSGAINLLAVIDKFVKASAPVYQQSTRVLTEHAEQGHPQAEYELGLRYLSGAWDVEQDEQQALSWITRAANSGHKLAMQMLADIYQNGRSGMHIDLAKASAWQEKAAAIP